MTILGRLTIIWHSPDWQMHLPKKMNVWDSMIVASDKKLNKHIPNPSGFHIREMRGEYPWAEKERDTLKGHTIRGAHKDASWKHLDPITSGEWGNIRAKRSKQYPERFIWDIRISAVLSKTSAISSESRSALWDISHTWKDNYEENNSIDKLSAQLHDRLRAFFIFREEILWRNSSIRIHSYRRGTRPRYPLYRKTEMRTRYPRGYFAKRRE
jgi:hypothetical protein